MKEIINNLYNKLFKHPKEINSEFESIYSLTDSIRKIEENIIKANFSFYKMKVSTTRNLYGNVTENGKISIFLSGWRRKPAARFVGYLEKRNNKIILIGKFIRCFLIFPFLSYYKEDVDQLSETIKDILSKP
ncbi:MAG: hypothetical protein WC412_07965 [Candidatus Omnitrophota bacterium]|jgi:hypothetical protein